MLLFLFFTNQRKFFKICQSSHPSQFCFLHLLLYSNLFSASDWLLCSSCKFYSSSFWYTLYRVKQPKVHHQFLLKTNFYVYHNWISIKCENFWHMTCSKHSGKYICRRPLHVDKYELTGFCVCTLHFLWGLQAW